MPIRINCKEINKDITNFVGLFYYLKDNNIEYDLIIQTKDSIIMWNNILKKLSILNNFWACDKTLKLYF